VDECFIWYRPTRVVPDTRPLNCFIRSYCSLFAARLSRHMCLINRVCDIAQMWAGTVIGRWNGCVRVCVGEQWRHTLLEIAGQFVQHQQAMSHLGWRGTCCEADGRPQFTRFTAARRVFKHKLPHTIHLGTGTWHSSLLSNTHTDTHSVANHPYTKLT